MRKVEERMAEKTITVKVKDPYLFCLDMLSAMEKYGDVIEKKNSIQTGGPRSKIDVAGYIKNKLDPRTDVFVKFSMTGDMVGNTGEILIDYFIDIISKFQTKSGIVSETFEEFYQKKLKPELRKISRVHVRDLRKRIDADIKKLEKKYK
ncbi:MAG: hypothetical protein J4473_00325 [Candidatus Aenigmarchaeota archaeon]|nr:hypothetical protein [Candidatus Aenigmarchaeota archaeon]